MYSSSDSASDDNVFEDPIVQQMDEDFDERFARTIDAQIKAQVLGPSQWRRRRRRCNSKRRYLDRGCVAGNARLIKDYFSEVPTYTEAMFRHQYYFLSSSHLN
uniref:Uncharacterized protein n=1 Tax=Aegilops tauschii subsp. strangulata TaxID=200361 RepID=A0A452YLC0_AEGTS